jgi:ribulose-bisphosphate carboxylase large chain
MVNIAADRGQRSGPRNACPKGITSSSDEVPTPGAAARTISEQSGSLLSAARSRLAQPNVTAPHSAAARLAGHTRIAPVSGVLHAVYRVRSDARSIDDRARAIAVEQSVEMPISAIDDPFVLSEIVGRVETIGEVEPGTFEVRVALATKTIGHDPGQLINMLFGNTSLHHDVVLQDVEFPAEIAEQFGGPRHGLQVLRRRANAGERALTCSALKPQGLSAAKLAELASRFARGGIDYVKDDHGLANQAYSPFAERIAAITASLRRVAREDGQLALYAPSLSGDLDTMRRQLAASMQVGIETALIAPMVVGLATFHTLVKEHPTIAFIAHPSMAGASRIAPSLLLGKVFRMLGADAVVFPNHGGRFGYSLETCGHLAHTARREWEGLRSSVPVPAGGMTPQRVPEMLDFYGADTMLLIGGGLLVARDRIVEETRAFVTGVRTYCHE